MPGGSRATPPGRPRHSNCKPTPCNGDNILLEGTTLFPLLRQQTPHADGSPLLCLSDFIRPLSCGTPDTIGLFASSVADDLDLSHDPYRQLLLQTLSDRLAEAAVEKMHRHVRRKAWGYAPDESLSIPDLLAERFQGIRPAVGYPSLPDQSVNFLLDDLLDLKRIGITLTENGAMHPHSSVSGLMLAHPAECCESEFIAEANGPVHIGGVIITMSAKHPAETAGHVQQPTPLDFPTEVD